MIDITACWDYALTYAAVRFDWVCEAGLYPKLLINK